MTHLEKLRQCEVCRNRDFDPGLGIVCALTKARPSFVGRCADHVEDTARKLDRDARARVIKPRFTIEQKRRFALLALLVILALGLAVGFLLHLRNERMRTKRSMDLRVFAQYVVDELGKGNGDALDDAVHFSSILAKAADRFDVKPGVWDRSVLDQFSIGWHLVRQLREGNTMTLIDVRIDADRAFALYRILGNSMDHVELVLDHSAGKVWVVDLFRYSTGVLLSDAVMEPELMRRQQGWNFVKELYRSRALGERAYLGYFDEVWDEVDKFDPHVRTSLLMRPLYLQLAGIQGERSLRMALDEITSLYPCDPRFIHYQEYLIAELAEDGTSALAALEQLEPFIGRDPWLGVLAARAHLTKGDTIACLQTLNASIADAPLDVNLHFERLYQLAAWGRSEAALQQADTMVLLLGYPRADIASFLDSIPGLDTSRALYDWR